MLVVQVHNCNVGSTLNFCLHAINLVRNLAAFLMFYNISLSRQMFVTNLLILHVIYFFILSLVFNKQGTGRVCLCHKVDHDNHVANLQEAMGWFKIIIVQEQRNIVWQL